MLRPGMRFFSHLGPGRWDVWAIDNYFDPLTRERTGPGDLTYRAKYQTDSTAADRLADRVAEFTAGNHRARLFGFDTIEAVCAVPYHGSKKLSLPHIIATRVAAAIGVPDLSSSATKTRATNPTKLVTNPVVDPSQFAVDWHHAERRVLVIDDVYRSGATLESLATQLRAAGVTPVAGVCATRATRGMTLN